MAVGIMEMIRGESRSPLLTDMLRRVGQDESRHAAFGVLSMRRVVRDASQTEMEEMEDWTFDVLEALNANQQLDMLQLLAPKYGFEPDMVVAGFTGMETFAEINSMSYMHTVVPNLLNLGLITERTESRWRGLGMMIDSKKAGPLAV
jgi:hypothetical protein